jgi:hypothetical protein
MKLKKTAFIFVFFLYSLGLNSTTLQEAAQELRDSLIVYWRNIFIEKKCLCTSCLIRAINNNILSNCNNKDEREIEEISIAEALRIFKDKESITASISTMHNAYPSLLTKLEDIEWHEIMKNTIAKEDSSFSLSMFNLDLL